MRSAASAILWETWRVTRTEAAWKLVLGIAPGLLVLLLTASASQLSRDFSAAVAMTLTLLPHLTGWHSVSRSGGERRGHAFEHLYIRPVRTAAMVGLPMVCLAMLSVGIYLLSALVLRLASGHAFPLLPVGLWVAAFTLVATGVVLATRNRLVQLLVTMFALVKIWGMALQRLTAVEIEGNFDWPPELWPALFDFPATDYAWLVVIGLVSFGVATAAASRQRRGEGLPATASTSQAGWLTGLFRFPCPTSSAVRAQAWLELKSTGVPMLAIASGLAIVILLVAVAGAPIDAALQSGMRERFSCVNADCFYVRAFPPLLAPLALGAVLLLGGNALGARAGRGRACLSDFVATQAHGDAGVAVIKLLVRSACLLLALVVLGLGVWAGFAVLGDAVFIQMWSVPLSSWLGAAAGAFAALKGHQQLAVAVVVVVGVILWVAALATLGALWARYWRRVNIVLAAALLLALALLLLAVAASTGSVPPVLFDGIFVATRAALLAGLVFTIAYVLLSGARERVLDSRYLGGTLLIAAAFAVAWLAVLNMAGVQIGGMPAMSVAMVLSPVLLPPLFSALVPWSLSRVRHV